MKITKELEESLIQQAQDFVGPKPDRMKITKELEETLIQQARDFINPAHDVTQKDLRYRPSPGLIQKHKKSKREASENVFCGLCISIRI